jgi:hypothetical protein
VPPPLRPWPWCVTRSLALPGPGPFRSARLRRLRLGRALGRQESFLRRHVRRARGHVPIALPGQLGLQHRVTRHGYCFGTGSSPGTYSSRVSWSRIPRPRGRIGAGRPAPPPLSGLDKCRRSAPGHPGTLANARARPGCRLGSRAGPPRASWALRWVRWDAGRGQQHWEPPDDIPGLSHPMPPWCGSAWSRRATGKPRLASGPRSCQRGPSHLTADRRTEPPLSHPPGW